MTLGARRDGTLQAIELAAVVEMGAGGWVFPVAEPALSLYACPNVRAMVFPRAHEPPRAECVPRSGCRGRRHRARAGDRRAARPRSTSTRSSCGAGTTSTRDQGSGLPYSSKQLLACYDRAAELAGWEARDALQQPHADGLLRGMGCATQIWWGGGGPPAHATIRLDADGRALVTTGIQDIGTGTLTSARIVAAEELGLTLDRVASRGGDTEPNLYGPSRAAR